MHVFRTFFEVSRDIKLLWLSVFLRLAAFGASNIVLTIFLKALGISETEIGIFMTCTLVGDTLISYLLTWYADFLGRRRIMVLGSLLMAVSGILFATSNRFSVLLVAAIVGVISPSGDEVGPFKSIEESTMAHLTPLAKRPDVYALHWLISCAGSAVGTLLGGFLVQYLQNKNWSSLESYRAVFYAYAAVSALKFLIMLCLSESCESNHSEHIDVTNSETDETAGLLSSTTPETESESQSYVNASEPDSQDSSSSGALSKETVYVLSRLLCVFMLDSFAYGFMPAAWIIYYFKTIYSLSPSNLGSLFFSTSIINSISSIPSSALAKALGPVKATLAVQVPSAVFLILTPLMYPSLVGTIIVLMLYYATMAMDVVPRQVLLTGLIKPNELTKAMGIVNIGKTFARCIGPSVTGKLANHGLLWVGFVISGSLTAGADTLLYVLFYGIDAKVLAKSR